MEVPPLQQHERAAAAGPAVTVSAPSSRPRFASLQEALAALGATVAQLPPLVLPPRPTGDAAAADAGELLPRPIQATAAGDFIGAAAAAAAAVMHIFMTCPAAASASSASATRSSGDCVDVLPAALCSARSSKRPSAAVPPMLTSLSATPHAWAHSPRHLVLPDAR
ncbi:hypothetical protein HYH02_001076 [Chlamydomonas schloesseri]|uniref:Uncharacterized protein n=1 Tax=Chlamydomonas schloesseri TaxID=2026947 RepID=A0A835WX92_9CHLO|nr:hypothetical protein HYH02_001076 [Chlamydomonas schloesseri]|eukprot:KAG2454035.1 hypothetical protein HYH02_001076 [Chlamydomonas schloesseri]